MHKIFLYFAALHYNILMLPIFLSPGTRFVGIECSCPEHGRTDFFRNRLFLHSILLQSCNIMFRLFQEQFVTYYLMFIDDYICIVLTDKVRVKMKNN